MEGLDANQVKQLCTDIVALANNPNSLQPIHRLFPEPVIHDGFMIIRIDVPQSSQVHSASRVVYDRGSDGDFRVIDQAALQLLYQRKSNHYTENLVFPYLEIADLRSEFFNRVRRMAAAIRDTRHPWLSLSDEQMLQSAGLWRRDLQTGQQGYTMAAALIFGKDETIRNVISHYDIDALVRRVNTDRYDDREWMSCNLLEAYDRLMAFVAKHLSDPFFLNGTQRVSLRDNIFREVIVNLLVHREYSSAHVARLVINPEEVIIENANRAYHSGPIDPNNFTPYPKNPNIANFFREIGLMDRLGSGVRNVTKFMKDYVNKPAQFIEGDVFTTVIPIPLNDFTARGNRRIGDNKDDKVNATVSDAVNDAVSDAVNTGIGKEVRDRLIQEVLYIIVRGGLTIQEIQAQFSIKRATAQRDMNVLKKAEIVVFSGAPKTGQYILSEIGRQKVTPK